MYRDYGPLSTAYYEASKPVGRSIGGDIDYYIDRLRGIEGQVLEAGVGTGRFLIPLLEEGFKADGIDSSNHMLEICRENLDSRALEAKVYRGDLLNLDLKEDYEAIVMPTGSFCLIEDSEKLLANFYKALKAGGRLIFDLIYPEDFHVNQEDTYILELGEGDGLVLNSKNLEIDYIKQFTTSFLRYEHWREGNLVDTELQKFTIYWKSLGEIKMLMEKLGFRNISMVYGYDPEAGSEKAAGLVTIEAIK